MRILFVASRLPGALLRGYEVRAFHQLRILGRRHRVTLVAHGVGSPAAGTVERLREFCDEVVAVRLAPGGMLSGLARGLRSGLPLQTSIHDTPAMRRTLRGLLAERRHDVLHVQLSRTAASLDGETTLPRVVDLIDALSLNMARRRDRDRGPMRWLAGLEADRLARYERHLCRTWDRALVGSAADREAIGDFPNLVVNGNGVDLERFPFRSGGRDPRTIVLTGNLGYFPNVDGALWFAREVLPRIRAEVPDATLALVGARPARAVRALVALGAHVKLIGPVPDLAPHLGRAAVAVAPLRAGTGQSLKVLEAMACGAAVVATRRATDGLDVDDERHLLLADGPEAFAQRVIRLLRHPDTARGFALEARGLVERRYDWETSVGALEALYESIAIAP